MGTGCSNDVTFCGAEQPRTNKRDTEQMGQMQLRASPSFTYRSQSEFDVSEQEYLDYTDQDNPNPNQQYNQNSQNTQNTQTNQMAQHCQSVQTDSINIIYTSDMPHMSLNQDDTHSILSNEKDTRSISTRSSRSSQSNPSNVSSSVGINTISHSIGMNQNINNNFQNSNIQNLSNMPIMHQTKMFSTNTIPLGIDNNNTPISNAYSYHVCFYFILLLNHALLPVH